MPRPAFPTSLIEFQRWFPDESACYRYLASSRWPDGFVCPDCGHNTAWEIRRRVPSRSKVLPRPPDRIRVVWECASCHRQVSLTAGTVLDATKLPLTTWFWAAFMVATDKRGMSAVLLDRQLDMGGHMTAWFLLHKLRRAMVNSSRMPLTGLVEVDGTYVGGYQPGLKGGRQRKGRKAAMVLAAVEIRTQKRPQKVGSDVEVEVSSRVRMEVVRAENGPWIAEFLTAHVARGSTIRTDGLGDYPKVLAELGYKHDRRVQGNPAMTGQVVPFAHRAISNMKAWLIGTHHGVGRPHLQAYLDEFVFRYNRRGNPEAGFQTLLGLGSAHAPVRRATIRKAADLPYYYEGEDAREAEAEEALA